MAYSTVDLISADFKDFTPTTSTNVKIADITQFIVEADALINAYIGSAYVVPVVVPGEGLELLKLLSRSLVTARIKRIMEVKQEKSDDANQNVVGVLLSPTAVMKILTQIQDKDLELVGAELLSSGRGFHSANVENDVVPFVRKEDRQW